MIKEVNPDIIFHFAVESFVSPSWQHPHRYMSVNYNGTLNILEGMKKIKFQLKYWYYSVERMVYEWKVKCANDSGSNQSSEPIRGD